MMPLNTRAAHPRLPAIDHDPKTPRNRIPEAPKATEPNVDWIALSILGNLLRHEYQQVDPVLLWTLLTL